MLSIHYNSNATPRRFSSPHATALLFPTRRKMQIPIPVRAPTFLSRRRLFEQKLADLHKCSDLNEIKQLHALIYKSNLHKDPFVAPKLISAFSLCRQLALAVKVFDQIPSPNAHLCNALIKAYIRNSEPEKAFEVFCEMRASGIFPDNYTVANARIRMWKTANKRPPGASLIELNGEFHEFTVMDTTHAQSKRIIETVNGVSQHLRQVAYAPSVVI
ncbi:hypothetical protein ACS0TY_029056 [Phlomoides rotata]